MEWWFTNPCLWIPGPSKGFKPVPKLILEKILSGHGGLALCGISILKPATLVFLILKCGGRDRVAGKRKYFTKLW